MVTVCPYCSATFHLFCDELTDEGKCCCSQLTPNAEIEAAKRGGPTKDASEMADPLSTGRKRAAQLKPIESGMTCEWARLAKAGGGVIPIIGCMGNEAKNIHHGPDKDTTNNEDSNLHRICSQCHNRWHSLNDPYYGERPPAGSPFVPISGINHPHDPETHAEVKEVFDHEMWWTGNKRTPYVNQTIGEENGI